MDSRDYVFFKIIFTKNLCFYFSQILGDGFLICFFFLRSFLFLADVFYFSQIFANFIRGFSLMLCADSCGWFLTMFFLFLAEFFISCGYFLFLADFRKFYSQILADGFLLYCFFLRRFLFLADFRKFYSRIFADVMRWFLRMVFYYVFFYFLRIF